MNALKSFLPLLFVLAIGPASAAEVKPPELVIHAPAGFEAIAERLRTIDSTRFTDAMRLVGLENAGPPIEVFLGPEGSDLAAGVPRWVSGYAYGEEGVIVLLPARTPSYPDSSLEELLRHEVAHVLVARAAGGRPLPRWFHEGLAMIAGLRWGIDDRSQLTLAMIGGGQVSLEELEKHFAGQEGAVRGAYAMAGAFANDLLQRHGEDAAARVLAEVARGFSFEEAFQRAAGESLAEAERSFWRRQTFWYRWVPVLTSSVTLWLLITLLALWAMGKRRARDTALRRLWEEEDRRLAEAPPQGPDDEPVN